MPNSTSNLKVNKNNFKHFSDVNTIFLNKKPGRYDNTYMNFIWFAQLKERRKKRKPFKMDYAHKESDPPENPKNKVKRWILVNRQVRIKNVLLY